MHFYIEIIELRFRVNEYFFLVYYLVVFVSNNADCTDGVMDAGEKEVLLGILNEFINPQTQNVEIDFNGKLVCLSGEFNYGSKSQVEEWLCAKGAQIAKSVTGKLDVLILGEAGSAAWKYGNYGSKYEKACRLNEKGKKIVIVKEGDVIA